MSGIEHIREAPGDPLGGATGAARFYVLFVGKRATAKYPYQVVNDRIASEIGRALGLWVPDSVLYPVSGDYLFFTHFIESFAETESGESKPPRTSEDHEAVLRSPRLDDYKHGVVMFDLFVANNDRKPDNIVLDPRDRAWLIDHGNALFYRPYEKDGTPCPAGVPRLEAVQSDLTALFDRDHHYLGWLRNWDTVHQWAERIAALPEFLLEHLVEELPAEILPTAERAALLRFLMDRKPSMMDIVTAHQHLFPALPQHDG